MTKTAKAYGKINLSLELTGTLPNGYHGISTVMQSVSLYNTVRVTKNKSGMITLSSDDAALPTDEKNTAFRAAKAFLNAANLPDDTGLDIFIEKRIPYQAGMGSASADAAGVLRAANSLFGGVFDDKRLCEIALTIGADVPFCLLGKTMLAQGIGEKLTPIRDMHDCGLLILHPNKGMSTPEAYRLFDSLKNPVQPNSAECVAAIESGDLEMIAKSCGNVFEQCCTVSEVFDIKARLNELGAMAAVMTGSGTAVFGIFKTLDDAAAAQKKLNAAEWRSWVACPVKCGVEIE